jgi:midasin
VDILDSEAPRKRQKTTQNISLDEWDDFGRQVDEFNIQHIQNQGRLAFGFVEGPLVRALRSGDWYVTRISI